MKQEYKDLLTSAILPHLVEMAINGTLPSDMNELTYDTFEGAVEKFVNSDEYKLAQKKKVMARYFCDDEYSYESQLEVLQNYSGSDSDVLGSIEGLMPWNSFEFTELGVVYDALP